MPSALSYHPKRGEQKMAQQKLSIDPKADQRDGINPKNLVGINAEFVIYHNPETGEPLDMEMRNGKNGPFKQYTLHLQTPSGEYRKLQFLFEKDLAPIARAYGNDPSGWQGQPVVVTASNVQREKGVFAQVELRA